MTTLALEQMEVVQGGGGNKWVTGACGVIGIGSAAYGIGVMAHWWNPIGWVSAAALVADAACGVYTLATL